MFTGIIEATAKVREKTDSGLVIERPTIFDDLKVGCSIAVSGACLTVTAFDGNSMSFDVIRTTDKKTKLSSLAAGDSVNLERAMKADGRFEGHIVLGHSEGVGRVVVVTQPAPTPGPSPWPSIAYAISGKQGEGSATVSQFNRLRGRIWKGTEKSKRPLHVMVERARGMRRQPTDGEKMLWQALKQDKIDGIRFRRQHPIANYILDFYADDLKLAIEIDGGIHGDPGQKEYEFHRTGDLNSRGISVMRFSNKDIFERLEDVLSAIHSYSRAPLTRLSGTAGPGGGAGGGDATLEVRIPPALKKYVVLHGTIMIDGVALTVSDLKHSNVTVSLIPHTLEVTTLGSLKKGDSVNLETDILAKYLLKHAR